MTDKPSDLKFMAPVIWIGMAVLAVIAALMLIHWGFET